MSLDVRRGVRLGVDVGAVRVGVAASDPTRTLASAVTVLTRDKRNHADLDELAAIAVEREAVDVIVGLPRMLRGHEGASAVDARDYAAELARRIKPLAVWLVDERMTTVTATAQLRAAGRTSRQSRPVIDAVAAVVILQAALDAEQLTGEPSGELVSPE
jgi:putative Holliday junction resolvase